MKRILPDKTRNDFIAFINHNYADLELDFSSLGLDDHDLLMVMKHIKEHVTTGDRTELDELTTSLRNLQPLSEMVRLGVFKTYH